MADVSITGKCLMGLTVNQGVTLTFKYIGALSGDQSHQTCVKKPTFQKCYYLFDYLL
jgi:hypothetical protein